MNVTILYFPVGRKVYKFRKPLRLDILEGEAIEGGVCLSHKELGLSACGVSISECTAIILEELETLWDGYASTPNSELTESGITFKEMLLSMVGEVMDYDPCEDCNIKEKGVCATCEYGCVGKQQRCDVATREYYGCDVE